MRLIILAIASGLAGLTRATGIGSLPTCADSCVNNYVSSGTIAGCASLDISCICGNSNFLSSIACCLASACNAADQESTITFAHDLCSTNGVNNLPDSISCSTGATAATTSASTSTSAVAATTTGTTATTSNTSSAPVATVSSSGYTNSTASGGLSTKATTSTSVISQTKASSSGSSGAAASATNNASPQNVAGVGAGFLAAFAVALL